MKVAVSGSHGFIGTHLVDYVLSKGMEVVHIGRDLGGLRLEGVDVVINLAGLAHSESVKDYQPFYDANVRYAVDLFTLASQAGVGLFIQVSSIGVLGDRSELGSSFAVDQELNPAQLYSKSKAEAERKLGGLSQGAATGLCIVRPPLVYGLGCKGNMDLLYRLASFKVMVTPFGRIKNRRDLVSVYNLVSLFEACSINPDKSSGRIFHVCDGETLSSPELLSLISASRGNACVNLPVPWVVLSSVFGFLGRKEKLDKFSSDLEVDMSSTCEILDWSPPYTVIESLLVDVAR